MQNISAISLGDQVMTKMVSRAEKGNATDSGQNFQTFMNQAGSESDSATRTPIDVKSSQPVKPSEISSQTKAVTSDSSVDAEAAQDSAPVLTKQQLADVENAVKDVVKDALGMDDETFEDVMAQMGITPIQLLNPVVLQDFILLANQGSDVTELLTSETMFGAFTDVLQALETLDLEKLTGMTEQEIGDMLQALENLDENLDGQEVADATDVAEQETVAVGAADNVSEGTEDVRFIQSADEAFVDESIGIHEQKMTDGLADVQGQENKNITDLASSGLEQEELPAEIFVAEDIPEQTEEQVLATVQMASGKADSTKGQTEAALSKPEHVDVNDAVADVSMDNMSIENISAEEMSSETSQQQGQSQISYRDVQQAPLEAQPQAMTFVDFVENMMQAVPEEHMPEQVNMQQMIDIVNQVVEQIHSSMEDSATTLEMQLNPESLGKLLLTVTNKNSVMTASFTVQTTEAKVALESQMATLRESLEQKNLKVEAVEVSVSDFAFSQSGQADTGDQKEFSRGNGRRARFKYDDGDEEEAVDAKDEAEQVRRSVMRDSGSSIDYTA